MTNTHKHAQGAADTHGSHQRIPQPLFIPLLAFRLCEFCHFSLFVLVSAWLQSPCLPFPDSFHVFRALCLCFVYRHWQKTHQSTGQQSGRQSDAVSSEEVIHYISNVEMTAIRQSTPWTRTHTHAHTRSSVWENRDRSQPDRTIAQRKRSIKQQVHFSAEAFKNMAAITLQELCWRGQEVSPH